jgi:hypothetical protein
VTSQRLVIVIGCNDLSERIAQQESTKFPVTEYYRTLHQAKKQKHVSTEERGERKQLLSL